MIWGVVALAAAGGCGGANSTSDYSQAGGVNMMGDRSVGGGQNQMVPTPGTRRGVQAMRFAYLPATTVTSICDSLKAAGGRPTEIAFDPSLAPNPDARWANATAAVESMAGKPFHLTVHFGEHTISPAIGKPEDSQDELVKKWAGEFYTNFLKDRATAATYHLSLANEDELGKDWTARATTLMTTLVEKWNADHTAKKEPFPKTVVLRRSSTSLIPKQTVTVKVAVDKKEKSYPFPVEREYHFAKAAATKDLQGKGFEVVSNEGWSVLENPPKDAKATLPLSGDKGAAFVGGRGAKWKDRNVLLWSPELDAMPAEAEPATKGPAVEKADSALSKMKASLDAFLAAK